MNCSTDANPLPPILDTLSAFRENLYHHCFGNARDALMNVCDALLTDTGTARSVADLSLSPFFARKWPSLYEAFEDGRLNRDAFGCLLARHAPEPTAGKQRRVLIVDASSILRPASSTARDRSFVYVPNLPKNATPALPGWSFSALVQAPEQRSSWTFPLSCQRICTQTTATAVAAQQLKAALPRLAIAAPDAPGSPVPFGDCCPLVLGDTDYSSVSFIEAVHPLPCDALVRLSSTRVLYRPAPPPSLPRRRGRPRQDGDRFKGSDPFTHGTPDATWSNPEATGQVDLWENLHFKECRHIPLRVLRLSRASAKGTKRDPRVCFLLFVGSYLPPLSQIPALYALRYNIEHGFRFDKQSLLWETPRLRGPEQFELWSQIVCAARAQLVLASHQIASVRRPWERERGPGTVPAPSPVRRAMAPLIARLGTPAPLPRPRGKSPGRAKGAPVRPAPRFPVVKKEGKKPKMQKVLV